MAGVKLTLEVKSREKETTEIVRTPSIVTATREKGIEVYNNDDNLS